MAWIECVSREMRTEPEDRVAWIECVSRDIWGSYRTVWPR